MLVIVSNVLLLTIVMAGFIYETIHAHITK